MSAAESRADAGQRLSARAVILPTPRRLRTDDSRLWTSARGMSTLLVLLVLTVFAVPVLIPYGGVGKGIADGALTLILVSGILATAGGGHLGRIMGALAIVAIAIRWTPWPIPGVSMPILREGSSLATMLLLAAVVAMKVFSAGRVTMDRVMGAVVLYLLLGLSWAMIYEIVAVVHPDAFAGVRPEGDGHVRWTYFSFVTLTTVGYGDITPLAPVARSLAILEALVGQIYPAVLLGRLVSLATQTGGAERD
jgi:hypothetical protein